jgi:hypothetical protein
MPRQKCDLAAFQPANNIIVGWLAEGRLLAYFSNLGESRHGIKAATADNPYLCLRRQTSSQT